MHRDYSVLLGMQGHRQECTLSQREEQYHCIGEQGGMVRNLQRRFVKRLFQIRDKLERGGTQEASQGKQSLDLRKLIRREPSNTADPQ